MTTSKGLGISIKYGDHSREMELRVNQHALGVRVPQGDNLRLAHCIALEEIAWQLSDTKTRAYGVGSLVNSR
jgi:hypothetical protein